MKYSEFRAWLGKEGLEVQKEYMRFLFIKGSRTLLTAKAPLCTRQILRSGNSKQIQKNTIYFYTLNYYLSPVRICESSLKMYDYNKYDGIQDHKRQISS